MMEKLWELCQINMNEGLHPQRAHTLNSSPSVSYTHTRSLYLKLAHWSINDALNNQFHS